MTTREAAARLGLSYNHTVKLLAAGRIPAVNVSTGSKPQWLITEEGLQAFLQPTNTPKPPRQPLPPRRKPVPDFVG